MNLSYVTWHFHMWHDLFMCIKNHPYMMWLIHVRHDACHSRHISFMTYPLLIHMCHDAFICTMTHSYVPWLIHDISHAWHIHGSFICDKPVCLDRHQLDWGGSGCRQDVPRIDRRGAQTRLAAGRTLFARIACAPLCLSRVISCASTSHHVVTSSCRLHKLCATLHMSHMDGLCHEWVSHVTLSHHHIVCAHSVCHVAHVTHG